MKSKFGSPSVRTPDPDRDAAWERIRLFVIVETKRIQADLAERLVLYRGWRVDVLSLASDYPPWIMLRVWLDADCFKRRGRCQLPPGSFAFAAALAPEDMDAAAMLVASIAGALRARLSNRTEFWLDYELKPRYHEMLEEVNL